MKSTWFHQYSWNSEVETSWISLIGWHHKTSTIYGPDAVILYLQETFSIAMIKNKAMHNLIDAKSISECHIYIWHSDWLDGTGSFGEPLCQTKVMQICQGERLNHQGGNNPWSLLFSGSIILKIFSFKFFRLLGSM